MRFVTQWNVQHKVQEHFVGDDDMAVPDLAYSIKELRERFVLETEILRAQARKPANYLFPDVGDDENRENEAFDSPAVEYSHGADLVDLSTDRDRIRSAVRRIKDSRTAAARSESSKTVEASTSKDAPPASVSGE